MTAGPTGREPALETFLPESADRLGRLFGSLDDRFAEIWLAHISALLSRTDLDVRTRFLVLTGQYTVTGMAAQLEENLSAALAAGVRAHELLEVILQCYVYTGPWVVAAACETYERVLAGQADPTANPTGSEGPMRSLEAERLSWSTADRADPRLEMLLDRYGWKAISNGLRLRPGHHLNLVDTLDALDGDFLRTWLDTVYDGMYGRGVLDDRTRLLCVVAATLALGEDHQSRRHMRAALRSGATARELLGVIFHTTAFFGHPYVMPAAIDDLVRIAHDEGCLGELVDADRAEGLLQIAEARAARRGGIRDDLSRS